MLTLTMTKGLPASGKSTWAKQQVAKSKGKTKRINKDDLRDMIDAGSWSKTNEKNILQVRDKLVIHYLSNGYDVIVDDTNLHEKHQEVLQTLAQGFQATFKTKSFLDVPLAECIKRDLKREKSVGERVIRGMFNQFLKPDVEQYEPETGLPTAIICDIDGTLAHMAGRSPFEWSRVQEDLVDTTVADILDRYRKDHKIILLSGRDGVCRPETLLWLDDYDIPYDELYMRPEGDSRKDSIVKKELFDEFIKGKYNVAFVLDDRNQVVEMWRGMGLKVLQVAEGDF